VQPGRPRNSLDVELYLGVYEGRTLWMRRVGRLPLEAGDGSRLGKKASFSSNPAWVLSWWVPQADEQLVDHGLGF